MDFGLWFVILFHVGENVIVVYPESSIADSAIERLECKLPCRAIYVYMVIQGFAPMRWELQRTGL